MSDLDIQIVDSLTVNLNQEDYSTEGQVLNDVAVYVEDEQLLFDAALTLDSIKLYTRETPDTINIKEITDGISKLESLIQKTSKESTLLAKIAELKKALNPIDITVIEQAIQDVEDVTAREATLAQGVVDIIKAVENIDFTDLENSIAEVKDSVTNIDFSAIAKEDTLTQVASKVEEESQAIQEKIDNIKFPEIDTTELAKQGDDKNATLTAIYKMLVGNDEPSQDIPEGVEELLALILEFYGIKPIQAYEFMTPEEVCSELEEIMTSMDLDFTPEQAKEITNNTLNKEY